MNVKTDITSTKKGEDTTYIIESKEDLIGINKVLEYAKERVNSISINKTKMNRRNQNI